MKGTFDYYKPVRKTIDIPKCFEFIYDGTDEDSYTNKQWDLTDEWSEKVLPKLLGIDNCISCDVECWSIDKD